MSDTSESLWNIIDRRLDRREFIQGAAATAAMAAAGPAFGESLPAPEAPSPSTLGFEEVPGGIDERVHVPPGYEARVVVGWGDPILGDDGPFDPDDLDADAQLRRFGFNNDFIGFIPLPFGSGNAERGLLCVNHEYTVSELMWSEMNADNALDRLTRGQAEAEMAAVGHSVVEIVRRDGAWEVVQDGEYNRRISLLETEMRVTGPAAGHDRLKTSADPTGQKVIGTMSNCAGGQTPWGTVLIAEENVDDYFTGQPDDEQQARNLRAFGYDDSSYYGFHKFFDRFNLEKEPNELNRFGWMVEYDPTDKSWTPRKRTALGRFKHEGATTTMNADGRIVLYSGDDEEFQHLYKFVTDGEYRPNDREWNKKLLDSGTLYAAKFRGDGTVRWLPLVHGEGPLTEDNGFASQADVLIESRRAASLRGATKLDRPEDVQTNPQTGRVYVMLTNNVERSEPNTANPRPDNRHGHVLELTPPYGARDHAAEEFEWDFFLLGGDPDDYDDRAKYHPEVSETGWITCPDNVAFDRRGRIWIATDQGSKQEESGKADGIYAADTRGEGRALTRKFCSVPVGAEACGPRFTPDGTTLFVAVQHPAERSSRDNPTTRWPDFDDNIPPRPAVIAITKNDGGQIGSGSGG